MRAKGGWRREKGSECGGRRKVGGRVQACGYGFRFRVRVQG